MLAIAMLVLTTAGQASAQAIMGAREDPYQEQQAKEAEEQRVASLEEPAEVRRTEWISGGPMLYVTTTGHAGGGIVLRALTFKWRRMFIAVVEAGLGGEIEDASLVGHLGSTIGYRFYPGNGWKHQLRVAGGLAFGTVYSRDVRADVNGSSGLYMLPSCQYLYRFHNRIHLGASLGMVMPVIVGDFSPYVMAVTWSFWVGF